MREPAEADVGAMSTPVKDIVYVTVLEAAQQKGCMFCRLISEKTRSYLDSLLYESVNNVGFRETWRKAMGFCHRHAWMLAEFGDAMGTGILYLDLLQEWAGKLLTRPAGRECPVCVLEQRNMQTYLSVAVWYWQDEDLHKAITASEGLCGPHLRVVRDTVRRAEVLQTFA